MCRRSCCQGSYQLPAGRGSPPTLLELSIRGCWGHHLALLRRLYPKRQLGKKVVFIPLFLVCIPLLIRTG